MSSDYATKITSMLEQGQDPKDFMIEVCKPSCKNYEDKLRRCQTALKNMAHVDPEMTCMYPLRDWVTCVDGCVIRSNNIRCNQKFTVDWWVISLVASFDLQKAIFEMLDRINMFSSKKLP